MLVPNITDSPLHLVPPPKEEPLPMAKEVRRFPRARTLLLLMGAVASGGCRSEEILGAGPNQQLVVPKEVTLGQVSGSWCGYNAADIYQGSVFARCDYGLSGTTVITNPAMTLWHQIDWQPPGSWVTPNEAPITISFSKLVYRVRLGTSDPFVLKCGHLPTATASGSGGSQPLTFSTIWPNEPVQCVSYSELTKYHVNTNEVFSVAGFNSVTIAPPQEINWSWLCTEYAQCGPPLNPMPRLIDMHGSLIYVIQFQEQLNLDPRAPGCWVNNELVDLQPTRELLDSLWKLGGGNGPDSLKIERGGYLYVDANGIVTFGISPVSTSGPKPDNACRAANIILPPYPGTVIAAVHVHPFKDGDPTTICHGLARQYEAERYSTFSGNDLDRLPGDATYFNSIAPGFQGMIVMDKTKIAFAPVGTTKKNAGNAKKPGMAKQWARQQPSGCTVI